MSPAAGTSLVDAEFIEVALPVPVRKNFTYRLPPEFRSRLPIGTRVIVPFGKRSITGYVVGYLGEPPPNIEPEAIKDVAEVLDTKPLLKDEVMRLAEWTADYYMSPLGEVLKASLPAGINAAQESFYYLTEDGLRTAERIAGQRSAKDKVVRYLSEHGETPEHTLVSQFGSPAKRALRELIKNGDIASHRQVVEAKVKAKRQKAVRLLRDPNGEELTEVQTKIIAELKATGGELLFTELLERADTGASPINTLAKRGLLEVCVREVRRDPRGAIYPANDGEIKLNAEQRKALDEIVSAMRSGVYTAFLLHGVTGSGKTEVYIRAMRTALENGRTSLMLVPEIALTPVFLGRLRAAFGDEVAILHSDLSPGERFDEWRRIRSGKARIVIGTRSAVFAPLDDLGLLVVDEEHDASYRQNESPFYSGRDVAVMRAKMNKAVIVLGSATPALESFYNARTGKYRYLQLKKRIGGRPLAAAELIDMREVFKRAGRDLVFSPALIDAIRETHLRGEQSILLLNRRGFASFVLCRSCGESLRCRNCDIAMTYHKSRQRLICHYCSHSADTPEACPFCGSEYLYFIGQGTEQLEELLQKRVSGLRIARVDRDTMRRKGAISKTLRAFDSGEIDVLVGTQILAKGHDFHNVTLVGVVSVDTGLGMPDFRSAERTFQLLTQVAGRAGRGRRAGRVLIQTYYPEHYALKNAAEQDYDAFYASEIRFRERLSYPPFVALASIMVRHRDRGYAERTAAILRTTLDRQNTAKQCRVIGPAPASVARIKNEFRMQIIVRSSDRGVLRRAIEMALAEAETRGGDRRAINVEIDPQTLL